MYEYLFCLFLFYLKNAPESCLGGYIFGYKLKVKGFLEVEEKGKKNPNGIFHLESTQVGGL